MNLELTPDLEQFVRARLATGEYRSQSEVVCAALRLLMQQEMGQEAYRRYVLDNISRGRQDASAGRTRPAESLLGDIPSW